MWIGRGLKDRIVWPTHPSSENRIRMLSSRCFVLWDIALYRGGRYVVSPGFCLPVMMSLGYCPIRCCVQVHVCILYSGPKGTCSLSLFSRFS